MVKSMEIKITKKEKLQEINNSMCHNFYYLIYGHIYNDEKTRYKKFKFVLFFDAFDIQEYFEQDHYTKDNIKEYINALIDGYIGLIPNYNNTKDFYNTCNDTIEIFNRICA